MTTLAGAFLLFEVQPLVSKAILPWFGGVPAVWTTCMLFFQVLLLGGYVYAHLLGRWLSARNQAAVHLAIVLVAATVLPILPGVEWRPPDGSNPTWRILLLLAGTVGLPYFALSATSPLVQTWFSGSLPKSSPYRLYALSNLGSLAALLGYPLAIEPMLDLPRQSTSWTAGFLVYAVFCAAALACVWRLGKKGPPGADDLQKEGEPAPVLARVPAASLGGAAKGARGRAAKRAAKRHAAPGGGARRGLVNRQFAVVSRARPFQDAPPVPRGPIERSGSCCQPWRR